jgi:hypothetical protein
MRFRPVLEQIVFHRGREADDDHGLRVGGAGIRAVLHQPADRIFVREQAFGERDVDDRQPVPDDGDRAGRAWEFEATSVLMLRMVGIDVAVALSATLLFRELSFWLPMLPGYWCSHRLLVAPGPAELD